MESMTSPSGARLGYGGAMSQELAGLSDQDLIDLAHYLSHFGSAPRVPSVRRGPRRV